MDKIEKVVQKMLEEKRMVADRDKMTAEVQQMQTLIQQAVARLQQLQGAIGYINSVLEAPPTVPKETVTEVPPADEAKAE